MVNKALDLVDEFVEDKDLANKIKAAIWNKLNEHKHEEIIEVIRAQSKTLMAEIRGESWLQRNWRPLLMMTLVVIFANNYLIAPYVNLCTGEDIVLTLPPGFWTFLYVGVGGYIGSRSAEKIVGKSATTAAVKGGKKLWKKITDKVPF